MAKRKTNGTGFVSSDGQYFVRNGKRFFPIGINYLPGYLCGNHFKDYRAEHIIADLDHISRLGMNCVRVAVFWADFEPKEGQYSRRFLTTFKRFLAECKERRILVMPVFLIGTWTGMYDAPYWKPPGMYQGGMLELEAKHIAEFVRHFVDEPAILCWDLSDEPWYLEEIPISPARKANGLPQSRRDIATNWVARLCRTIRDVDPNHLITLGSDPEPTRKDTGFALEEMAEHLDVMAYCIYPQPSYGIELDLISYGAFQARIFAAGKPPFLHEGPGVSSSAVSEDVIADRFRAWMYSSLANGNIGVLPWCYTDYEQEQHYTWPLDDKPQEPSFGICFADRKLKKRGEEFLRFAQDVRLLPLDDLQLEPSSAAFVYPMDYYERAGELHNKLWRHFTVAKGANLNIDIVREDRLSSDMRLLIVPGFRLRLSTWAKLRDFVKSGGHLLMISDEFFALNPIFPQLFGVTIEGLRPGSVNANFRRQWGHLGKNSKLAFGCKIERLWVKATAAETIASFDDGYPFLLCNCLGKGKAYLATFPFPLRLDLGEPRGENSLFAVNVLKSIRDIAGCRPTLDVDSPWVETAIFRSTANSDDWGIMVNYDRTACDTNVVISDNYSQIRDAQGKRLRTRREKGNLVLALNMEPNGSALLQLRR